MADGQSSDWRSRYPGKVPEKIERLYAFDAEWGELYTDMRELVYCSSDDGIPPQFRELLFVTIAAVTGNVAGARVHLEAGKKSGLTLTMVREMLRLVVFEFGANSWATSAEPIWQAATEILPET